MTEYTDNPELGELEIVKDVLPSPAELANADQVVEGEFGRIRQVEDFLPSPAELAQAPEVVKVTIGLSSDSVEFFKEQAKQHNTSYQRMIRRLLDEYVAQVRSTEETKAPR